MLNVMRNKPHQKQGLIDLLNYCDFKSARMLEIGSYAGESTQIFLDSKMFAQICCLDPWLAGYDPADYASNHMSGIEKVFMDSFKDKKEISVFKNLSAEIVNLFPNNYFDFVYIDACHTYEAVIEDINVSIPKIKSNGFIAGHDYGDSTFKVTEAVNDRLGSPTRVFADSSWIFPIKNLK